MTCKTICSSYLDCGGRNLSTLLTCNGNGPPRTPMPGPQNSWCNRRGQYITYLRIPLGLHQIPPLHKKVHGTACGDFYQHLQGLGHKSLVWICPFALSANRRQWSIRRKKQSKPMPNTSKLRYSNVWSRLYGRKIHIAWSEILSALLS